MDSKISKHYDNMVSETDLKTDIPEFLINNI